MDSQKLQQLKDEMNKAILEGLSNSNLAKVFEEYGMSGHETIKVECMLDLTQLEFSETVEGQQAKEFLRVIPGQELLKVVEAAVCPHCGPRGITTIC